VLTGLCGSGILPSSTNETEGNTEMESRTDWGIELEDRTITPYRTENEWEDYWIRLEDEAKEEAKEEE
jgi:hypothetical protein